MEFNDAVLVVLKMEGGYAHNINDPGGETNFGISKRAYPQLDIKALTPEAASVIYRRDYWDRLSLRDLPAMLRLPVFDAAVNQGPGFAVGTLQAIVGVQVDGKMGPKTLSAVSTCEPRAILSKYMWRRLERYAANPKWPHFGAGWAARLLEVVLENQFS